MTNAAATPMPSAEDVLEDQILQAEDSLDEGARYPMMLNFGTVQEPDIRPVGADTTDEEKQAVATESVRKRAMNYDAETYRYASFRLSKMNEVEAVDAIRELTPGDRDIWLRAEFEGQARDDIFTVFGLPPEADEE